jgi:hypothetical protein
MMKEAARLCPIVQGVEFWVEDQGRRARALILAETLVSHFGASPDDLLASYRQHRATIDEIAQSLYRCGPKLGIVIIRGGDLQPLEPPPGCAGSGSGTSVHAEDAQSAHAPFADLTSAGERAR